MYLIPGVLGFIACCLFDINKIKWHSRKLNLFFVLGVLCILGSTAACILQEGFAPIVEHFGTRHLISFFGLLLSVAGLIYSLFFALPFDSTYTESGTIPVVDRGVYGACRHPGFWMLALVYLFLWLFFFTKQMLAGSLLYTFCNFLYIFIQDKYIFPEYIQGYEDYKQKVPFLVPNRNSLHNAFRR